MRIIQTMEEIYILKKQCIQWNVSVVNSQKALARKKKLLLYGIIVQRMVSSLGHNADEMVTIPKEEYRTLKVLVTAMMHEMDCKEFVLTKELRRRMVNYFNVGVKMEWCGEDELDERYYLTGPDGKRL